MKNTFLIYIVCAVLPLLAVQRSGAQSFKAERALENQIIDAVSDFDAGRYAEAKERLETLVAVDPDNDAAYYYLGMTALMQNDLELAETGFETAVQLDSSNFWYRHRLAGVYAMTDRKELTVEIYNGLLKDFPKKSDLYYSLIELYLSMGRMEDALSTLDQIDTVFGRSDVSVMTRFDILRRLGRME